MNKRRFNSNKFSWVNISHAKKLAEIMGWKFLDKDFKGINEIHNWKCEKGHKFSMRYANIYFRGNFCSECRKKIPPEELDYNNPKNRYNLNKEKIQREMSKKKGKAKKPHLEIVQFLRSKGVKIKYAPKKPTQIIKNWIIIGDGIKADGIFDFVKRKSSIKKEYIQELDNEIRKILAKYK
jgi:hypothetical protein